MVGTQFTYANKAPSSTYHVVRAESLSLTHAEPQSPHRTPRAPTTAVRFALVGTSSSERAAALKVLHGRHLQPSVLLTDGTLLRDALGVHRFEESRTLSTYL